MEEPPTKIAKVDSDAPDALYHATQNPDSRTTERTLPKKKTVAVMFSYCGAGYHGMQLITDDPSLKSIEAELRNALHAAKAIDDEDYESLNRVKWQRASRTDKGVSAVTQLVSLKMRQISNAVKTINDHLPDHIHIHRIVRTTQSFDAKKWASSRHYTYILPTYALIPPSELESNRSSVRVSNDRLQLLRDTLKRYIGTKNYFNFTSHKSARDPSAARYIISFDCDEPILYQHKDGNEDSPADFEFVMLRVHGQSFLLHQIRKMVGLAVAVTRGNCNAGIYEHVFDIGDKFDIPKIPAQGLLLEQINFDYYNRKFGNDHEKLEWFSLKNELNEFKEKFIYSKIMENEIKEKTIFDWLETLPYHTYTDHVWHWGDGPRPNEMSLKDNAPVKDDVSSDNLVTQS